MMQDKIYQYLLQESLLILLLTLAVGRIYCSIICPLGILQDLFIRLGNAKWLKKVGKHFGANRFRPAKEMKVLRFMVLALFIVLSCFPITAVYAHFLEPYSLFGKAVAAVTSSYYSWAAYGVVAALFLLAGLLPVSASEAAEEPLTSAKAAAVMRAFVQSGRKRS